MRPGAVKLKFTGRINRALQQDRRQYQSERDSFIFFHSRARTELKGAETRREDVNGDGNTIVTGELVGPLKAPFCESVASGARRRDGRGYSMTEMENASEHGAFKWASERE